MKATQTVKEHGKSSIKTGRGVAWDGVMWGGMGLTNMVKFRWQLDIDFVDQLCIQIHYAFSKYLYLDLHF